MRTLTVIKIGGNIIDDAAQLAAFLVLFSEVEGPKILVHGGGKIASRMGERLGIASQYVDGRRVTDAETLSLVAMVYGGLVNKDIVAKLQGAGCNAVGLSGCDAQVISAHRRTGGQIDYGFAGDLYAGSVNVPFLKLLLEAGIVPVLAPLSYDGASGLLNTNADTIAQEVAKAFSGMQDVQLIYSFDRPGLLSDAADDSSVIPLIREEEYVRLRKAGIITDGMIPKMDNAFAAIRHGVRKVILGRAKDLQGLISGTSGTHLQ